MRASTAAERGQAEREHDLARAIGMEVEGLEFADAVEQGGIGDVTKDMLMQAQAVGVEEGAAKAERASVSCRRLETLRYRQA